MTVDFMSLDNYHLELMRQNVSMIQRGNTSIIQSYKNNINNKDPYKSDSIVTNLSERGKEFSTYYQDIKGSDNDYALEGLKKLSFQVSNDPNNEIFYSLDDHLKALKESDYNQYINFFEAANEVGNQTPSLSSWLNNFTLLEDTDHQSLYIDLSKAYMSEENSDYENKSSFSIFLKEIRTIIGDKDQEQDKSIQLKEFFDLKARDLDNQSI